MRAYLPDFEMQTAKNLKDALSRLAKEKGNIKPIAGGTDIMVVMAAGGIPKGRYLNIWGLKELKKIKVTPKYVEIGALVTFTEIRNHPVIKKEFPNLVTAASETGAIAIQNRGTIGGNIANASPAADTPPALLAYGAEIELVSKRGVISFPYREFHTDYKKMRCETDELIRCVRLPRRKFNLKHFYRKVGTRKAQAISKVCLAANAEVTKSKNEIVINNIGIGFGSVAATPLFCEKTSAFLTDRPITNSNYEEIIRNAKRILGTEISPIDDIRSNSDYRKVVALNVFEQFLKEIVQ